MASFQLPPLPPDYWKHHALPPLMQHLTGMHHEPALVQQILWTTQQTIHMVAMGIFFALHVVSTERDQAWQDLVLSAKLTKAAFVFLRHFKSLTLVILDNIVRQEPDLLKSKEIVRKFLPVFNDLKADSDQQFPEDPELLKRLEKEFEKHNKFLLGIACSSFSQNPDFDFSPAEILKTLDTDPSSAPFAEAYAHEWVVRCARRTLLGKVENNCTFIPLFQRFQLPIAFLELKAPEDCESEVIKQKFIDSVWKNARTEKELSEALHLFLEIDLYPNAMRRLNLRQAEELENAFLTNPHVALSDRIKILKLASDLLPFGLKDTVGEDEQGAIRVRLSYLSALAEHLGEKALSKKMLEQAHAPISRSEVD